MAEHCSRCKDLLTSATREGLCDTCENVIKVLGLKMPGKKKSPNTVRIVCPDCRGAKGRYMNTPQQCCGQGCCYTLCGTCEGTGKISVPAQKRG